MNERERFEAFASRYSACNFYREPENAEVCAGHYVDEWLQLHWETWKAAKHDAQQANELIGAAMRMMSMSGYEAKEDSNNPIESWLHKAIAYKETK